MAISVEENDASDIVIVDWFRWPLVAVVIASNRSRSSQAIQCLDQFLGLTVKTE
jgi:hypothetical protein